jgi:hypothetical protein
LPGQQLADTPHRAIRQPREHVGETSTRINAVELGGLDQGVDRGGAASAFVGSREGQVVRPSGRIVKI